MKRGVLGTLVIIAAALVAAVAAPAYRDLASAEPPPEADAEDAAQVQRGTRVYGQFCASCHGFRLEGQRDWRKRLASGRLPAPPHDESGHTWHHPDGMLFAMTKDGLGAFAPAGYETDMPAFGETLSDRQIWDVLAFIKSRWPEAVRSRHKELSRMWKEQQER
jgi:mono/diheme cytochrome c family protein